MRPLPTPAVFVTGMLLQIPGAIAQSTAPSSVPLIAAPAANAPAPSDRPRTVSSELAAKLSLNAPKFVAPKTTDAVQPPETPDHRETDKPANGIVRLPNYVVREPKVPVLKERELLTRQGRLELAYKRHPGLRLFGNSGLALALLREEERLEDMAELKEAARMVSSHDKTAGAAIQREVDKTFQRSDDYGWRNSRK